MRIWAVNILVVLILAGCGVTFKTQTLDSHVRNSDRPISVKRATVFKDFSDETWGIEEDSCKNFRVNTEHVKVGSTSLELEWDKAGCDWIGLGFGWNAWLAKDLRDELEAGEIEFYIRSAEGEAGIPTIVMLLEDYSGTMTAAVFNASHITSYPITEEWQRCAVPMNLFPYKVDGFDPTNVKQMVWQLEAGGHVLIDDISIQPARGVVQPGKKKYGPSVVELNYPNKIFDQVRFDNVWGLEENDCRDYRLEERLGRKCVAMTWDEQEECDWMEWGTSWTEWLAVDFSANMDKVTLAMSLDQIKPLADESVLWVGFENYSGHRAEIRIDSKYISDSGEEWKEVMIPLTDFFEDSSDFNLENVKQLYFRGENSGEVLIGNILLVANQ